MRLRFVDCVKGFLWGIACAAAISLALPSRAQAQFVGRGAVVAQQPDDLSSDAAHDNTSGVYVRDSAIALEKLAHAQRMESLKEWGTSADLYQEILEKYPDRVVPVPGGVDSRNRIVQYASVTEEVRRALCKWPPAGLDVYRSRYESTAADLVKNAKPGDLSNLQNVFSLYFPTDSAKVAGIRLMDAYFETGEYAAVAQIGRRLLEWHPNLVAERPKVLYRVAIAEKLCDDTESAARRLQELQVKFPQAAGTIKGEDVILADSLAQELKTQTKIVRSVTTDSWTTFGGDVTRGKNSSATGRPGAKLYSIPLGQRSQNSDPNGRAQDQMEHKDGMELGVMPVADHGELFFQDNIHLYAIDLDSGLPLPGWLTTYPSQKGQYQVGGGSLAMPIGEQLCVTLTDKYVTAIMGLPDRLAESNGQPGAEARFVCLDRETGREIWQTSVNNLQKDQGALRTLKIGGAPLVVGDNVFVTGHGGKGQQFEDSYVLCFDLASGKFNWASYLASAASEGAAMNPNIMQGNGPSVSDAVSHLAYASGRVYAASNLGAVAAIDAYSGTIVWLDIYRDGVDETTTNQFNRFGAFNGMQQSFTPPTPPWVYNAAVVQDGKVFILPSDKKAVLIYDAGTGKEINRIRLDDYAGSSQDSRRISLGTPDTLLAVRGDVLILSSERGAWQIPWKKNADQNVDGSFWESAPFDADEPGIRGRGFVTPDAVYLPTTKALIRLVNGAIDKSSGRFPKNNWDDEEGPGNVLVTQDQVIIAGDRHVDVYTDLSLAISKLDREVSAAPGDPQPQLRYSEVMFAAGQTKLAQDKLGEALQLMTSPQGIAGGPIRDRAFNDALTFATKFADRGAPVDETNRMFDSAAATAQSPSQQVAYRMARATFDQDGKDLAGEVDCYQQILSDDAMRLVPQPDPATGLISQAGIVAEKAIDQIKPAPDHKGIDAYAKYEAQAAAKLAEARAAGDPQQLLMVAQVYPNAEVARDAMVAAADVFESKGNFRMSTQVLRRLLNKYHDSGRVPVLEAMARNYLKIPGRVDVAIARLGMAAQARPNSKLSKPLTLPDGSVLQDITYKEAQIALGKYIAAASTESLPEFNLPPKPELDAYKKDHLNQPVSTFQPDLLIPKIGALVKPIDGFARYDRIVTWTGGAGVSIYPVGVSTPVAVCPAVDQSPTSVAWIGDKALVWGGGTIHLIAADTGKPQWKLDLASLPATDIPANDAAPEPAVNQPPPNPNVVVQPGVIIQGQVFINVNGRQIRGPQAVPAPPVAPPVFGAEHIDQVRPVGDRIIIATSTGRLFAIDSNDGRLAWQTRVSGHAVDHLCANDDFTVMRIVDDQMIRLMVLNSYSGELVGRKSFSSTNGQGDFPVNLALSPDGTLVYTTSANVCIKDLYEVSLADSGMEPQSTSPPSNANPPLFMGCDGPDQLLISQGRIYAVAEAGREIHVFDVDSAQPTKQHNADANGSPPMLFSANNKLASAVGVALRVSGNYLYIRNPHGIVGYKLSEPSWSWVGMPISLENVNITDWLFGKDYVVAVAHRAQRLTETNKVDSRMVFGEYSRRTLEKHPQDEIGTVEHAWELQSPGGILDVEPIAGGIVYLGGDNVLHTLLGAHGHMLQ